VIARVPAAANLILAIFDEFYRELCAYRFRAKRAFEGMDPQASNPETRVRRTVG
jgi:hypothetical protein